jgi:hypothetical protein
MLGVTESGEVIGILRVLAADGPVPIALVAVTDREYDCPPVRPVQVTDVTKPEPEQAPVQE